MIVGLAVQLTTVASTEGRPKLQKLEARNNDDRSDPSVVKDVAMPLRGG